MEDSKKIETKTENVPAILRVLDQSDEQFFSGVAQLATDNWDDGFFGVIVFTIGDPYMLVDGMQQGIDASPVVIDSEVLIPVSALIEVTGGSILIGAARRNVTIKYDCVIEMEIDSKIVYVDGKLQYAKNTPVIIDDSVMLATDIISEALNFEVDWNPIAQQVTLTRNFQTRRLILRASAEIDLMDLGAITIIKGLDNIAALQFATIKETRTAYEHLSALAAVVWVEPDYFVTLPRK